MRCNALCRMGMKVGRRLRPKGLVFDRGLSELGPNNKTRQKDSRIDSVLTATRNRGGGWGFEGKSEGVKASSNLRGAHFSAVLIVKMLNWIVFLAASSIP
jgi:hypothetical protein